MNHRRLECYAPAGTAIMFDTNGIHRLRRFDTRVRELPSDCFQLGGRGRFLMHQLLDGEEYHFAADTTTLRMFKRY